MQLFPSSHCLSDSVVKDIISQIRPFSMVTDLGIDASVRAVVASIVDEKPGVIAECGVWKGGCSIAILLAQRAVFGKVVKPIYLLDSFEGLPDVDAVDGPLAQDYQANRHTEENHNNCIALIDEVEAALRSFGFGEGDYHLIKGWYDQTVPTFADAVKKDGLAVLRLDCDWYASVMVCLNNLEPIVVSGGAVIIDDYYSWDGCAVALHEYLGVNKLPYRLRTTGSMMGVCFEKKHRESMNEL